MEAQLGVSPANSTDQATKGYVDARNLAPGIFAARPAAGNAGALYFAQDNDMLYRDNGSSWDKVRIGADSCSAMGDVPTSGWTAVNMQTGASWASDKDAMLFTIPTIGSGHNFQYQYRTYPSPPFTLTIHMDVILVANVNPGAGAALFAGPVISDGTKLLVHGPSWINQVSAPSLAGGWQVGAGKWTNVTTPSSFYNTNFFPLQWLGTMPHWYRVTDDNVNLTWSYSINGIDWSVVAQESRTAFLTPSRIGICADSFVGDAAVARVRSWNGVA